jgi:hypothetical protein
MTIVVMPLEFPSKTSGKTLETVKTTHKLLKLSFPQKPSIPRSLLQIYPLHSYRKTSQKLFHCFIASQNKNFKVI